MDGPRWPFHPFLWICLDVLCSGVLVWVEEEGPDDGAQEERKGEWGGGIFSVQELEDEDPG